jgi:RNA polymerase sigma-70 factor (ECF subfamily)
MRKGQADSFEQVVRDNVNRLLSVARRMLRNEDDARDAVQECFLSAFRALDSFQQQSHLSTWLHRICVNACLMKLRSRRRAQEESIDDLLPRFLDDGHHAFHPPDWTASADVLLERHENRQVIRESIDRLPEPYRTVLLLRDIEELDTAEAAKALGVSETVVKVRLHRARQALRTLLEERFKVPTA